MSDDTIEIKLEHLREALSLGHAMARLIRDQVVNYESEHECHYCESHYESEKRERRRMLDEAARYSLLWENIEQIVTKAIKKGGNEF